jgi:hypothetical protein
MSVVEWPSLSGCLPVGGYMELSENEKVSLKEIALKYGAGAADDAAILLLKSREEWQARVPAVQAERQHRYA